MLITAVIGGNKNGNTSMIVRQFEESMKKLGDVEFKYIYLTEAKIADCRSCFVCIGRGETLCPLKDDLLGIEKQLMESDGAVFASPNHACGVTAPMRRLIERFAYIGHRPRFFGRYAVAVATSGGPVGIKQTLDDLSYFAGGGFSFVGRLGLMTPPTAPSPQAVKSRDRKVDACAARLYRAITEKKVFRPSFGSMMQFAAFRGMYMKNPILGEAKFPADMQYWRKMGWLDKHAKHFQKGRIGMVKRAFGLLFETIIGLAAAGMKPEGKKSEQQNARMN